MSASPDRWEHGSEFHWLAPSGLTATPRHPWQNAARYGSGRDALRGLVAHGRQTRGWQRLWMPTYFCQEVTRAIAATGIELALYRDDPLQPWVGLAQSALRRGDALFLVNTLGLRDAPELPPSVEVVEDHTHDPWSPWAFLSRAHYCVASLRKTLPLPDGGLVWSPAGEILPAAPPMTGLRRAAATKKLAAMLLKGLYLQGRAVDKETFRALAMAGEEEIALGDVSGISEVTEALLNALPVGEWRATRQRNVTHLRQRLREVPWLRALAPARAACAFSCAIVLDHAGRREHLRRGLIHERIYPAVLWPLEETVLPVPDEERALSRRMLSLHCDARYSTADLDRVAGSTITIGAAWRT